MKQALVAAITALSFGTAAALATQPPADLPPDVVAKVGEEAIRYSQINTMLNSAPVVGLSIPALGTPERNEVMLALLDKAISANLLYLDAIREGLDQDPDYQKELRIFSDGILGGLYRARFLVGDIAVTPEEVDAFYQEQIVAGTELDDRLRAGIEAVIRKDKFKQRTADMRERLRAGIEVRVLDDNLDVSEDPMRGASDPVATYGERTLTWGEVAEEMTSPLNTLSIERRVEAVNARVDQDLMAQKGRAAGLENDPIYQARVGELKKTSLVNLHREGLVKRMEPTEEELRDYYDARREQILVKERRKLLMVVLKTREEAEQVKARIDNGEITIYQAAMDYSIHPDAKENLGDFGWVAQGTGFPELDALAFSLELDVLGGPVESPAGWHLLKVVDLRDARFTDVGEEETRNAVRRLVLKEKLNDYVIGLRKNAFPVVVYEDNLKRLFQAEGEWIADKTREMEQHPERAEQILEAMRKQVE